jgi:hypothetical protein
MLTVSIRCWYSNPVVDRKKLFIAVAALTTVSMAVVSFIAIGLNVQKVFLAGIFIAAGLITSAIVCGAVGYFIRSSPDKDAALDIALPEAAPAFDPKSAQTLMILQKKGRLIDFLQEDISEFDDKQIGHAIRAIHKGCKEALVEYMKIEPVRHETEGQEVTVEAGFDPSSIRLTGSVAGQPPFRGVLRHCGWRIVKTSLPGISKGQDSGIIEPAEVEIL